MDLKTDCFQDAQDLASAVHHWDQIYSQITAGSFHGSLTQIAAGRCHVFRERINQRVVQQGQTPRGKVCFAIPIAIPGVLWSQGREGLEQNILVLRGGQEFMFHMPMGMDILALSFDEQLFEEELARTRYADETATLLKQPVIRVPSQRFAECRRRVMAMFSDALCNEAFRHQGSHECELEQALLDEILGLLVDPACNKAQRHGSSTHSFIVEKCHRLTVSNQVTPLGVIELSEHLHVNRGTVQNSFRRIAETTPLKYLRSIRLNGVRRELMATTVAELSVGDAAARWGFFHLSHFAADYQQLFAELPSQTKRQPPSPVTANLGRLQAGVH